MHNEHEWTRHYYLEGVALSRKARAMAIDPKVFKQVRKALGLTQQELADAIGLSRVTINKMEQGRLKRGIPDDIAARLMALKGYGAWARPSTVLPPADVNDHHLWDNEEDES